MGLAKLAAAAAAQQPGGSPQRKGSAGRRGERRTAAGGLCWLVLEDWHWCRGNVRQRVAGQQRGERRQYSRGVLAELGSVGVGPLLPS